MSVSEGIDAVHVSMVVSDAAIAEYKIVQGDIANTTNDKKVVKVATADTHVPVGITQAPTTVANQDCPIAVSGIVPCMVDGNVAAIDINDRIVPGTAGKGVKFTALDAVGQESIGIAMEPSTADNDVIDVKIQPAHLVKGTA